VNVLFTVTEAKGVGPAKSLNKQPWKCMKEAKLTMRIRIKDVCGICRLCGICRHSDYCSQFPVQVLLKLLQKVNILALESLRINLKTAQNVNKFPGPTMFPVSNLQPN